MSKTRIPHIDIMLSLLTVLVIIGHCNFSFQMDWYQYLHLWIYSFHMGAFYLISGFLMSYVFHGLNSLQDYFSLILRKFIKFGIPFIVLGAGLCGFSVWRQGGDFKLWLHTIYSLFADPASSPVIYLWFIYVLFFYYLIGPILCQWGTYLLIPALFAGAVIHFYPLPRFLCGHLFSKYFVFFVLGIIFYRLYQKKYRLPDSVGWMCFISFIFCSLFLFDKAPCLLNVLLFSAGLCTFSKMILQLPYSAKIMRYFEIISRNCFEIYLFQMLFLQGLALLFCRFSRSNSSFLMFLFFGIVSSIVGSIWISQTLRRLKNIYATKN